MATQIPLTQGLVCTVDDRDADLLDVKWYAVRDGNTHYARRKVRVDGKQITVFMHRLILARKLGRSLDRIELVDHVDRNGLNNLRSNLRLADHVLNGANRQSNPGSSSQIKGVTKHKQSGKWQAQIRSRYLGLFDTPAKAARAYDEAAIELFGEYALLNNIADGGEK